MARFFINLKCAVAAAFLVLLPGSVVAAGEERLAPLFERLKSVASADAQAIEDKIWQEWSKSGSPAMDLLLDRGRKAMEAKDYPRAIEHFSALIDHAPLFAEGWNARATAFFQVDQIGLSLNDIRRTLQLEPRHFGAMSGLAIILNDLGYPEQALAVYRQVRMIHPHRENITANIQQLEAEVAGKPL